MEALGYVRICKKHNFVEISATIFFECKKTYSHTQRASRRILNGFVEAFERTVTSSDLKRLPCFFVIKYQNLVILQRLKIYIFFR